MKRSSLQAMQRLAAESPLEAATPIPEWTRQDEDALLAHVLEAMQAPSDRARDVEHIVARSTTRTEVHRIRRAVCVAGAACAAAAVALGIALNTSGSPGAFAAWSATTSIPSAARHAAAAAACRSFAHRAVELIPNVTSGVSVSLSGPLRLTDSRGPFQMLVYSGSSGGNVCLWDSAVLGISGGGGILPAATELSVGVPTVGLARHDGLPVTYAYGTAGTQVTAVTLKLANGMRIEATVQNGLYGAWWPSQTDVTSVIVRSTEGVQRQDVGDIGPNLP